MTDTTSGSSTCHELAKALRAAQAEMKNPPKDSVNPHFKSRYADLATIRDAVLPALAKHGLCIVQMPCEVDQGAALRTLLMHESGEWIGSTMLLRATKTDPQGIGSALTYCRRYALQSIVCVSADDDDDGNADAKQVKQPEPKPAPKAEPQPAKTEQPKPQPAKAPALGEGNTSSDLSKLLGDVADARKVSPMAIWGKVLERYGWQQVATYDELKPDQLEKVCGDLRATLKQGKAGAK